MGSHGPKSLCRFKWGLVDSQRGQEAPRGVPSTSPTALSPPTHPDGARCPSFARAPASFQ